MQNNYSLIEEVINPADQIRRDALAQIQAVIPFTTRQIEASVPQHAGGTQYALGLRNISALAEVFSGTGVLVSGPFPVDGSPRSCVSMWIVPVPGACYLYCKLYDEAGTRSQPAMAGMTPSGTTLSFQDFLTAMGSPTIVRVEFFLKWVLDNPSAVLRCYLLQVS